MENMDPEKSAIATKTAYYTASNPTIEPGNSIELSIDAKEARRLNLKIDLHVVPILGCLYLLAFLDRTNISNAKLNGFEKELHMPSNGYNTALWVFYLTFSTFEVPNNIILSYHKVEPNLWLAILMFCLGVTSMCQGLVKNGPGLYACRAIMGIFESGVQPGGAFIMSQYYRRSEFAPRFAVFICFALIGAAFSAFLAYAIQYMDGIGGYAGWRWIFILEGIFTALFGIFSYFVVPKYPEKARFLNERERTILIHRLEVEHGMDEKISYRTLNWAKILLDWRIWVTVVVYFCADMSSSSTAQFSPTILKELGWSNSQANLHAIPIYLVSVVLCILSTYISIKIDRRTPFIFLGACLSLAGWVIQRADAPSGVRYLGLFLIFSGSTMQLANLTAWLMSNLKGRPQKAVGAALLLGLGNSCNFVSSNVFIAGESPKYPTAFTTGIVLACIGLLVLLAIVAFMLMHNKKIDRKRASGEIDDDSWFKYNL